MSLHGELAALVEKLRSDRYYKDYARLRQELYEFVLDNADTILAALKIQEKLAALGHGHSEKLAALRANNDFRDYPNPGEAGWDAGWDACKLAALKAQEESGEEIARLREALEKIAEGNQTAMPPAEIRERIDWIDAELEAESTRLPYGTDNGPPCRNGWEVTELLKERAELIARAALEAQEESDASDDVMIGEFIARWDEAADGVCMDADTAQALAREFKRMRGLIYVPGVWRCAKCSFRLVQSNLNMTDGTITSRDDPGEKCPNDGSPLWRVTYRDDVAEAYERWRATRAKRKAEGKCWQCAKLVADCQCPNITHEGKQ